MYTTDMKRLQIMIDEDLDLTLDRLSGETGKSKAALIRDCLRQQLQPLPPLSADPLGRMAGADDFEPAAVEQVVYP